MKDIEITRDLTGAIQLAACKLYGIPLDDLLGDRRTRFLVRARQRAIATAHAAVGKKDRVRFDTRPGMSLVELGQRFNRDHTTVIHALSVATSDPKLLTMAIAIDEAWETLRSYVPKKIPNPEYARLRRAGLAPPT